MKKYTGKWIDSFNAIPNEKGILLETPSIDYQFSKQQWEEFKTKINKT